VEQAARDPDREAEIMRAAVVRHIPLIDGLEPVDTVGTAGVADLDVDAPGAETVVEKVRRIMETLAVHGSLGLSALSRESGLSKTTVHRLCGELVEWGIVARSEGEFTLGSRLSELGHMAPSSDSLRDVGHPYLVELFAAFRLPVTVSILHGTNVRCVDKVSGSVDQASHWMGVGTRAPAHATSAGKAIVAFSPQEVFDAIVAKPLVCVTPYTVSVPARLAQQMREIRRTGIAYARNETRIGAVSLGVPIVTSSGRVLGAVGMSLTTKATKVNDLEQALKVQAGRIARQLQ
jgi:DNA-binding IclR family transcriptional regulator